MNLENLSAVEIGSKISSGQISSREATEYFLERSSRLDASINAYTHLNPELALESAQQVDSMMATGHFKSGTHFSPLAGVPVAIKDVLCLENMPTTCGSRMLENYFPPYTATCIGRLKDAGLIPLGKTNMDEFAMGSSTETSAYGVTRNPWDLSRTPGGSSGGSAAVLAAGMAPLSVGTDTGGSVRQPAAFCGVVGLKPTYGLVSRYGLVAYASSLDQVGPMALHVEDLAALLQVMAGHDVRDSTSLNVPIPDYMGCLEQSLQGLRIGIVGEHIDHPSLDSSIRSAVQLAKQMLESSGATVKEIHLPHSRYSVAAYYVIAPSEASSNLARYDAAHYGFRIQGSPLDIDSANLSAKADSRGNGPKPAGSLEQMVVGSRTEGMGEEVKRRILLGTFSLSAGYSEAFYKKAMKVRRLIADDYRSAFDQVDLLLGPVVPTPAFRLGEKLDDPVQMYLGDLFTVEANLAGLPAISLPCGQSPDGLPLAVQLQAPHLAESQLLAVAYRLQQQGLFSPQIAPGLCE